MDRRMLPLNSLRAFEATGIHLSFTRAAESLSVTQSAISRHVLLLEDLLGVKLLERRHHQLDLTPEGKALLPVVTQAFDRIGRQIEDILKQDEMHTLRIALPPSFAMRLAMPILRDFQAACPDIALELESPHNLQDIDHTTYDLAVIFSRPQVTDSIMDLLWMERLTPICHPCLFRPEHADDPDAFVRNNMLLHVKVEDDRHHAWRAWLKAAGLDLGAVIGGLVFDTAQLAVQYALGGHGVVVTDPRLFEDDIRAGRLVTPFHPRISVESGYGYFLTLRPDDLQSPAVELFRSWLIRHFSSGDRPTPLTDRAIPSD